ncbi:MAG: hypothetical protein M3Y60_00890 [Bacteroidota bacterium]|nr:hypothetical protein [Bacteroidota bacterium]
MITVKFQTTAGLVAVLLLLVSSCQDDPEISAPIAGKWKGTLAEVDIKPLGLPIPASKDDPSFDAQIEFRPDGVVIINDNAETVDGTYQQSNESLTINIDYSIEEVNLSDTYTIETLTETLLVFYVNKKGETLIDPTGAPAVKGRVKITLHFERL